MSTAMRLTIKVRHDCGGKVPVVGVVLLDQEEGVLVDVRTAGIITPPECPRCGVLSDEDHLLLHGAAEATLDDIVENTKDKLGVPFEVPTWDRED